VRVVLADNDVANSEAPNTGAMATSDLAIIGQLPTIALDDLNEIAGLQTRIDRKYLLTLAQAERALSDVAGRLAALDIAGSRSFRYNSLYFDTPEFTSYRAAATSRRRRFKVRVRHYVDSGFSALEVKTRGARGETVKTRLDCEAELSDAFTLEALQFIDGAVQTEGLARHLRSTMWTAYHRSTLADLEDRSRITIDRCLQASPARGRWRLLTDNVIIETKSTDRTTPLDRALWADHVRPVAISKYAIAMALHDPSLPANRWNRVLRDHFGAVP
jgi:hypothetical protein